MPSGIDAEELAQQYGWSMSLLKSDKELWGLFNQAVKGSWDASRFVAKLRDTKWFKHHTETWRQSQALRLTDPATWNRKVQGQAAKMATMAAQLGVPVNKNSLAKLASNSLYLGWDDNELRRHLAAAVNWGSLLRHRKSNLGGLAGETLDQMEKLSADYGIKIGGIGVAKTIQKVIMGDSNIESFQSWIKAKAKSMFPSLAAEIDAGKSVREVADPYIQTMGDILEINPNNLTVFDPKIKSALIRLDKDKQPYSLPLWQFETELRKDPRWYKTKNAQDSLMNVGHSILQSFGLVS
jgi:hypothetical protein